MKIIDKYFIPNQIKISENKIPIKYWSSDIDDKTLEQATNLSNHPKTVHHVALMPDCHMGYGMPIGGVIALKEAIIPNAVGVDIGCGMLAVKTSLKVNPNYDDYVFEKIIEQIYNTIPVGFNVHSEKIEHSIFYEVPDIPIITDNLERAKKSMGTLGGGNHFIEIQRDEENYIWIMIHSGSRNLGKQICDHYNKQAKYLCDIWESKISNNDLAFLPINTPISADYIECMEFAVKFAFHNRIYMLNRVKFILENFFKNIEFEPYINISHNFASLEEHFGESLWIHRKGATQAYKDQLGIIPGSMGTNSYIVRGLGNPESYMSCSHGAGRAMGRNEATRNLTVEQCEEDLKNVIHRDFNIIKRGSLKGKYDLGEAPRAYKDIDEVMENQKDLVEIVTKLTPIASVKG